MVAGLVSALLQLVRPEATGAEVLLAAGLIAAGLALAVVLRIVAGPRIAPPVPSAHGFAALRVRLRASDPSAAGHRRARAPGTAR